MQPVILVSFSPSGSPEYTVALVGSYKELFSSKDQEQVQKALAVLNEAWDIPMEKPLEALHMVPSTHATEVAEKLKRV